MGPDDTWVNHNEPRQPRCKRGKFQSREQFQVRTAAKMLRSGFSPQMVLAYIDSNIK